MATPSQVRSLVDQAFRAAGGLVTDVTFTNITEGEYNFTTGARETTTGDEVTIQGIKGRQTSNQNGKTLEVIFKTQDVDELTNYDSVHLGNDQWKVEGWQGDDYTLTATLKRER